MRLMTRLALVSLFAAAACEASAPPAPPVKPPPIVYGVAAPLGTDVAAGQAAKAAALLSSTLGREVEARVLSYDQAAEALGKGELDVALVPPLTFVRAQRTAKLFALRKAVFLGQPSYRSVLFVRGDSKVKTIADLERKRLALVKKGSLSGNLVPRGMIRDLGIEPAEYFSSLLELPDHGAVCNAVASKKAEVGASLTNYALKAANLHLGTNLADVRIDGCTAALGDKAASLRAILMSEPLPNALVALRAGFPDELGGQIGDALDTLSRNEVGRAKLQESFGAESFVAAFDDELEPLRRALDFDEGRATQPPPSGVTEAVSAPGK